MAAFFDASGRSSATALTRTARGHFVATALVAILTLSKPGPAVAQTSAEARNYVVYFTQGKSEITSEARAVLQQASAFQTNASGYVTVAAHTDSTGNAAANARLSRRRAIAVRDTLKNLGVPARSIALVWKGETAPPHPGQDNVREPLNRCAVITITPGGS